VPDGPARAALGCPSAAAAQAGRGRPPGLTLGPAPRRGGRFPVCSETGTPAACPRGVSGRPPRAARVKGGRVPARRPLTPGALMTQRLNLKLLGWVTGAFLVLAVGVHVLHGYQVRRNAGGLLRQADRAEAEGRPDRTAAYLGQYLALVPDDLDA